MPSAPPGSNTSATTIELPPNQPYEDVSVGEKAILTLKGRVYYIRALLLEEQAEIKVQGATPDNPVIIYLGWGSAA